MTWATCHGQGISGFLVPATRGTRPAGVPAFAARADEGLTCADTIAAPPSDQRQHDERQVCVNGTVDKPRLV